MEVSTKDYTLIAYDKNLPDVLSRDLADILICDLANILSHDSTNIISFDRSYCRLNQI